MTTRNYLSTSQQTTLTAALNSSATTMVVSSAANLLGTLTLTAGQTFTVVIDPDTSLEEIVDVVYPSAYTNTSITVVRGVGGTTAVAHSAGAVVRHMAIGRDFTEANRHIEASAAYNDGTGTHDLHGLGATDGSVVGTDKAQTLTNKTLTSPTITGTGAIAGTFTGNLTGNASTATSLATARDFQLLGDVEAGAVSFNGTGNVSLTTSIATGAIVNADVNAAAGITYGKLNLSNSIVNADIATGAAISKTKISGTAITAADTGTVTSAMIADGTIVNGDISSTAAIDKTKIAGTAITAGDTGTVTSTMIADGTIVNGDINASAGIAYSKLSLNSSITSADIVNGTIVDSDINSAANIALSKLATDPLARANHTGTQTASTISDFDTQVRTSRLDQMAAPTASVAMNAQKITGLADPSSAQDAVTLNYITTQKGAASGIASLDGSGLIPTSQLPAIAISETFVVASQAAMLALTAQTGDIAVRTDLNKSFILTASPASTLGNWQELLTPTDAVLSVDGNTGAVSLSGTYLNRTTGQLLGNLNANNYKVTNLATPTSNTDAATKVYVDAVAGSAAAAAAAQAATEAVYDSFDDRYLGSKSTAPTLDNDGNALITGALYWNSTTNAMYAWTGSAWGSISSTADIFRYRYTATGGETSKSGVDDNGLTLSYLVGKEQVYLNGNLLARAQDYTASNGTSITSLAALSAGDVLEIITFTPFDVTTSINKNVISAKGDIVVGTAAQTPGVVAVGTNGQYLQADSTTATGLKWSTVSGYSAPTLGSTVINSGATVTTISGLTLSTPTLSGTVTASGDINLSGAGAVGSVNDEFALLLMGAI